MADSTFATSQVAASRNIPNKSGKKEKIEKEIKREKVDFTQQVLSLASFYINEKRKGIKIILNF